MAFIEESGSWIGQEWQAEEWPALLAQTMGGCHIGAFEPQAVPLFDTKTTTVGSLVWTAGSTDNAHDPKFSAHQDNVLSCYWFPFGCQRDLFLQSASLLDAMLVSNLPCQS